MRVRRSQQGSVLIVSLVILLVMTLLGVGAMTDAGLQERMVANQKQLIQGTMAAEAGAIAAIQWLNDHPQAWADHEVWRSAKFGLTREPPKTANFGDNSAYWIEEMVFAGNQVVIRSRGGIFAGNAFRGQSRVTVVLQAEEAERRLPGGSNSSPDVEAQIALQEADERSAFNANNDAKRRQKTNLKRVKVLGWRQAATYEQ